MTHLSSFELENFRTFGSPTSFELAPLTILTGPNSSGKSSVFKALLLLQESTARHHLEYLDFHRGQHGLASYNSVLSRGKEPPIRFRLGLTGEPLGGHLTYRKRQQESDASMDFDPRNRDLAYKPWRWPDQVYFSLTFKPDGLKRIEVETKSEKGLELLFSFSIDSYKRPLIDPDTGEELDEIDEEVTFININGELLYKHLGGDEETVLKALGIPVDGYGYEFVDAMKRGLCYAELGSGGRWKTYSMDAILAHTARATRTGEANDLSPQVNQYLEDFKLYTLVPLVRQCMGTLVNVINGLDYTGAFRTSPRRLYSLEEVSGGFADLLHQYATNKHAKEKVEKWLSFFGVGEQLSVEAIAETAYLVTVQRGGEARALSDMGYGHAQLLPLIMQVGLSNQTTLLVEEPEANLHPNLQSRLADLFVELIGDRDDWPAEYKRNFWAGDDEKKDLPPLKVLNNRLIVETHSEYLIRRLQYLVASGQANPERIVIYYLGPDPSAEDYVRQIRITESGQLSQEFGPGFFDESTNLMVDLYKYGSQN